MSSNGRLYLILGLVVLIIAVLIAIFFEYRPVVDRSWEQTYDIESRDPGGTWLFAEVLKDTYSNAQWSNGLPTTEDSVSIEHELYIRVAERGGLSEGGRDSLLKFINAGNTAMIFTRNFGNLDSLFFTDYYDFNRYREGTLFMNAVDSGTVDPTSYAYVDYNKELLPAKYPTAYRVFENEYYYDSTIVQDIIIMDSTTNSLMIKMLYGENGGAAYLCGAPQLVTNIGLQQPDVVTVMDRVLQTVEKPSVIHWDNSPGPYYQNEYNGSPLKYILSQKALRLAYYLLLGLALLFLIFRSKRRQKAIPLKQEHKNTSLEYIDTLSKLYQGADHHEKLVIHLEKIFYHRVEKQYFISKDHPDFATVLAKKSRQEEEEIQKLQERFASARAGVKFSYYQLQKVSERIDTILETTKHAST